jgi:hypothetical protein
LEARELKVGQVGGLATQARRQGFPVLRGHTFESTLWIIATGIKSELEESRGCHVLLVDRPVTDAFGYLLAALESRAESISAGEEEYVGALVRLHSGWYDVLLMTEIDPDLGIDTSKERDMDESFRRLAAAGIREAFRRAGISPERVDCRDADAIGRMAERLAALVATS